jgi:hypothetical protein
VHKNWKNIMMNFGRPEKYVSAAAVLCQISYFAL